jgi:hypothetical protein
MAGRQATRLAIDFFHIFYLEFKVPMLIHKLGLSTAKCMLQSGETTPRHLLKVLFDKELYISR